MKFKKNTLLKFVAVIVAVAAFLYLLFCFPQPFFHASVSAKNLTLFSDRNFSTPAAEQVLQLAMEKLSKSPLYSPQQNHQIFICNDRWRQRLFFTYSYGVGGVNYYPFTTNVFLRDSIIEENCLISPSGKRVEADRSLDYYIAHEITHTLTGQAVGAIAYHRLPQWKREGYADYVGKGSSFNYDEARRAFLADDPKMNYEKSGLYRRFHLLVAYLLDKQHWSVQRLLTEPIDQQNVEAAIRDEQQ